MTIHHTMNAALTSRHMMPIKCTCGYCLCSGFDRDQMADVPPTSAIFDAVMDLGGTVCTTCEELMWLDYDNARDPVGPDYNPCPKCTDAGRYVRDPVRGITIINRCAWCGR